MAPSWWAVHKLHSFTETQDELITTEVFGEKGASALTY